MEEPTKAPTVAAALADPVRRALLAHMRSNPEAVSRDDAATALGIPRATAAFHLEKLAASGLLATEFQRRGARSGPGAGRPTKLYRLATDEIALSFPSRQYELAAELLSSSIEESERSGVPLHEALENGSTSLGRTLAATASTLEEFLELTGYEPVDDGDGGILLANCPFHRLAQRHPDLICGANVALVRGAAEVTDSAGRSAQLDPGDGRCCVRLSTVGTPA